MTGDWTENYFDTVYLLRWSLGLPTEATRRHVDFLLTRLSLTPGDTMLDVGCGQGRYSLAFADRGIQVTGLDASGVLLQEARRLASEMGVAVEWVRCDMRRLPSGRTYASAILFDAFGYFDSDQENEGVVRQIAEVLEPGGRMALAVVNGTRLLRAFKTSDSELQPGRLITIRRQLDAIRRVVREEVTVEEHGRQHMGERRQRLYGRDELVGIATRSHLIVRDTYGDLEGSPFDDAGSPRVVLVCERVPPPLATLDLLRDAEE